MLYKAGPKDKLIWLKQHGGRGMEDVFEDEFGEYVIMCAGRGKEEKVYLSSGQPVENPTKSVEKLGTNGGKRSDNFSTTHR